MGPSSNPIDLWLAERRQMQAHNAEVLARLKQRIESMEVRNLNYQLDHLDINDLREQATNLRLWKLGA